MTAALVEIGGGGGDLTRRLDESRADELGDLARGFNRFLGSLRDLIGDVLATSERLRSAVGQVAQVVDNTASRAGRQHEMTDMVATAVHEMGLTVQEIARNASNAAQSSHSAREEAQIARQVVGQSIAHIERMSADIGSAAEAVGELAEQVASIDQVLAVIRGISEQTNLLALNAAIEAARAGEAGRGFAVVADEVRGLAQRTQKSTEEIEALIAGLQSGTQQVAAAMRTSRDITDSSVELTRKAGVSLASITQAVSNIQSMNQQIAAAAEEQSAVAEEISRSVISVRDISEQTASASEETAASSAELARLGGQLQAMVSRFRV